MPELFDQNVFELFGALSDKIEKFTLAEWANVWRFSVIVAVMANDPAVAFVICKCDVAILASERFTARTAQNERRKAASIEQNDRLLSFVICFFDRFDQLRRKDHVFAGKLEDVTHVGQFSLCQRPAADPVLQLQILVLSGLRVVERLKGGRCRAEHDHCIRGMSTHNSNIAAVIKGRFVLTIRCVVLFIDDHKANVLERRKDRGTRSYRNSCVTTLDPPPFVEAFARRQIGMKDRNALPKHGTKPPGKYRSKRDLRHKHKRRSAHFESGPHCPNVNLGLTAAGDAMKEKRFVITAAQCFFDRVEDELLFGVERDLIDLRQISTGKRIPANVAYVNLDQTALC